MLNNSQKQKPSIAIIGAGMAGITVARQLSSYANVTVFDKSRGVGGRLATRYHQLLQWDHGAQFFTIQDQEFLNFLLPCFEANEITPWHAKFAEITVHSCQYRQWGQKPNHYVGTPKMNLIVKRLAMDINIHLNTKIVTLKNIHNKWQLFTEDKPIEPHFDWVVLAIPSTQAIELLPKQCCHYSAITDKKMLGCYALMLAFSQQQSLPWDAALIKDSILSWISVNTSKPGRSKDSYNLVALASNNWAEAHMEDSMDDIQKNLLDAVIKLTKLNSNELSYATTHRWRYANIAKQNGPEAFIDPEMKIAVCGDWCIQGRVEAAYQSGSAAAKSIFEEIY